MSIMIWLLSCLSFFFTTQEKRALLDWTTTFLFKNIALFMLYYPPLTALFVLVLSVCRWYFSRCHIQYRDPCFDNKHNSLSRISVDDMNRVIKCQRWGRDFKRKISVCTRKDSWKRNDGSGVLMFITLEGESFAMTWLSHRDIQFLSLVSHKKKKKREKKKRERIKAMFKMGSQLLLGWRKSTKREWRKH